MNQIRLSELLPGKTFHWLEFFVRNIPNARLESRVIPESQYFQYLQDDTKSKTKLRYDQWPRVRFPPAPLLTASKQGCCLTKRWHSMTCRRFFILWTMTFSANIGIYRGQFVATPKIWPRLNWAISCQRIVAYCQPPEREGIEPSEILYFTVVMSFSPSLKAI